MYRHFWTISKEQNKENIKSEIKFFAGSVAFMVASASLGYWFVTSGFLKLIYFIEWLVK